MLQSGTSQTESRYTVPMIPTLIMVACTNFAAMMNTASVTILLPVFMKQFHTDIILTQWIVTSYMLATCIVAPVVGYISDRISLKRTFLVAICGFSCCNILLGVAGNIYMIIAMRVLQGIFGGMLIPVSQAMIYQYFPRHQQAKAVSIWATTNLLAPTLAPSIAGAISDIFGWRYIFLIVVPVMMAIFLVAMKLLPARSDDEKPEQHAFDFSGLLLSTVGSFCLLLAFSNITVWGLISMPVLLLTAVGFLSLVAFFCVEHKKEFPMLQVKVFSYGSFLSSVVILCVGSIFINICNNVLPVFLQDIRGFSTTQTALMMLPAPLAIMFIVPLLGKYYDRIGPYKMLTAILCVGVGACLVNSMIGLESSVLFIVIALILRDMGGGTTTMPATNMGMQSIPTEYATHAAAVTSWAKQCAVTLAVGLGNTFQTARTQYYVNHIAADYGTCYANAMSDLFQLIIIFYVVGFIALYLAKRKESNAYR